jgi:DNA-binding transcriptional LysR family regulator
MELRHLEHFVAVAEEQSFTRAARRLHLVQSALSVSIRSLERELDASLFERTTREVRLTDAGRLLLPEARRTIDAAAAAQAAVLGAQEGLRGTLRLGMMQLISIVDVGALIARFHRDRPLVDIRPRAAAGGTAALISDVRRGLLDAAFVAVAGARQPGLAVTTLGSEPVLLACPPDHPLAGRASVAVSELADEPFVDFTPGWGTRTLADQLFARAGIERSIGIEVSDASIHAALVRAGLGLAILPRSMTADAGLTGVPLRPTTTFSMAFVVPSDRPLSPVTRAFADLVATTREEPAELGPPSAAEAPRDHRKWRCPGQPAGQAGQGNGGGWVEETVSVTGYTVAVARTGAGAAAEAGRRLERSHSTASRVTTSASAIRNRAATQASTLVIEWATENRPIAGAAPWVVAQAKPIRAPIPTTHKIAATQPARLSGVPSAPRRRCVNSAHRPPRAAPTAASVRSSRRSLPAVGTERK